MSEHRATRWLVTCLFAVTAGATAVVGARTLPVVLNGQPAAATDATAVAGEQKPPPPAAAARKIVGHIFAAHLSEDGFLVGRLGALNPSTGDLIPATRLSVNFVQNGKVILATKPGVAGIFQAKLTPGTYSVIAAGGDGYFAGRLQVLPAQKRDPKARNKPVGEIGVVFEAAVVTSSNLRPLRAIVRQQIGPALKTRKPPAPAVPVAAQAPPLAGSPANTLRVQAVRLAAGGTLRGRVRVLSSSGQSANATKVRAFAIRDGKVVGTADLAGDGRFNISGLSAGVHAVVIAGPGAFAAFSVELLAPTKAEQGALGEPAGDVLFVSLLQGDASVASGEVNIGAIGSEDLGRAVQIGNANLPGGLTSAPDPLSGANTPAAGATTGQPVSSIGGTSQISRASAANAVAAGVAIGGIVYAVTRSSGGPNPDGD